MELYVTRHGETEWNAQSRVCGLTDVDLTPLGEQQAARMAESVAGYPITRILCSPLLRARKTADYAARALRVPVETEPRLIELNYGRLEGTDRRSEAFLQSKRQLAARYPEGESALDGACRVYSLLEELRNRPDETFLLVAHNGICRIIHTYFHDLTNEEYFSFSYDNCQIRRYEYQQGISVLSAY